MQLPSGCGGCLVQLQMLLKWKQVCKINSIRWNFSANLTLTFNNGNHWSHQLIQEKGKGKGRIDFAEFPGETSWNLLVNRWRYKLSRGNICDDINYSARNVVSLRESFMLWDAKHIAQHCNLLEAARVSRTQHFCGFFLILLISKPCTHFSIKRSQDK